MSNQARAYYIISMDTNNKGNAVKLKFNPLAIAIGANLVLVTLTIVTGNSLFSAIGSVTMATGLAATIIKDWS